MQLPEMSTEQLVEWSLLNWATSPRADGRNYTLTPVLPEELGDDGANRTASPSEALDAVAQRTAIDGRAAKLAAQAAGMVADLPQGLLQAAGLGGNSSNNTWLSAKSNVAIGWLDNLDEPEDM